MAGNATDYLETKLLEHTLAIAAFPKPATVWIALCISTPTDATKGTEVSGGGYVRMQATFAQQAGRTDTYVNSATIEWPTATAPWGVVSHTEIWDAATAGNRLFWEPLVNPADMVTPVTKDVQAGDTLRIQPGGLRVSAD